MQTVTIIYKLSVTNLEFTLGFTENTDDKGNKINDFFLPMSLRVEDTSVEKSNDGEIVDFIFAKDASVARYDTLLVEDKNKTIPENIKHLISDEFYPTSVENPSDAERRCLDENATEAEIKALADVGREAVICMNDYEFPQYDDEDE